jgi:hypothetical protein
VQNARGSTVTAGKTCLSTGHEGVREKCKNSWFYIRWISGMSEINTTRYQITLTFSHPSFTFHSNKSPTRCKNFSVYYPDVCLQLNMFRVFFLPSSGAQWLQWQTLVLPSYRGDSRAVFVVGPAGRRLTLETVRPLGPAVFPSLVTIYSPHLQWSCQVARATEFFTVVSNIHEHPPPPPPPASLSS